MHAVIAVLPGDGIGPEVTASAVAVLEHVAVTFGHEFELRYGVVGGDAYEKTGEHCPDETLRLCRESRAVLFGAVGGPVELQHLPKWRGCEAASILRLRKELGLCANLRPITLPRELAFLSPLKPRIVENGVDVVIIRELVGDVYFGVHEITGEKGSRVARDVAEYTEDQILAAARAAEAAARARRGRVTSVDKANVLATSRLWREVVTDYFTARPDITLTHMLVDNCAMQLVSAPEQFDVILTSNLFGDILSDEGAAIVGSLGLLPSASLPVSGPGLFEPISGSAPGIAGKDIANPVGSILSAAMLLRYGLSLENEARAVERAVLTALTSGARTADLLDTNGGRALGTLEFTGTVVARIGTL